MKVKQDQINFDAKIPIHLRTPQQEDLNFIYSSWLKSYRDSEDATRMHNDVYYTAYRDVMTGILAKSGVLIACNPDDTTQVYGYLVFEILDDGPVFHYIYTKFTYRKLGIANEMAKACLPTLGQDKLTVSHANRVTDKLMAKYNLYYNPFKR